MKRVLMQEIEDLEAELQAAPPAKVARLVKKLVRLKKKFFYQS